MEDILVNSKHSASWSKGVGRKLFREGATEKWPKIALLSLYLLYLFHVWKSRGGRGGARPPCRRPCLGVMIIP